MLRKIKNTEFNLFDCIIHTQHKRKVQVPFDHFMFPVKTFVLCFAETQRVSHPFWKIRKKSLPETAEFECIQSCQLVVNGSYNAMNTSSPIFLISKYVLIFSNSSLSESTNLPVFLHVCWLALVGGQWYVHFFFKCLLLVYYNYKNETLIYAH